jgi:hypothetical protein
VSAISSSRAQRASEATYTRAVLFSVPARGERRI